jgi:hypothetical protein
MKKTSSLRVFTDLSLPKNRIIIHPNDGFDLGLTGKHKLCALYLNSRDISVMEKQAYLHGCVVLDNSCHSGTVNINTKIWKSMGRPHNAVLACKGNSIFFITKR